VLICVNPCLKTIFERTRRCVTRADANRSKKLSQKRKKQKAEKRSKKLEKADFLGKPFFCYEPLAGILSAGIFRFVL
jgi:hypothetical protein